MYLQLGNGVTTSYAYRLDNRRLDALQAQLPNVTHYRFQNLAYRYDNVGNILGIANNSLYPKGQQGIGEEVGGPVTQSYVYDELYRLKEASGEYRHEADELRRYRMGMDYDSIHNIVAKEQLDEEVEKENGKTETEVEHETSYTYGYHYAAPQTGSNTGSIHPHAPSEIGHYSFQYDANGNQLERRYRDDEDTRQIVWDEDNRMGCVHEFEHEHPASIIAQVPLNCSSTAEKLNHDGRNILNGSHTPEVRFVYNDRGERVFKESDDNVSFYLNPHYTEKSDDAYKHILIGTTRLVTQEVERETHEAEDDLYYYHPDHLGSSSFVTDRNGKLEEHLEYFPFGETWIEEESSLPIAFQFTAKELDSETGLYYFGARYYDPRTSVWQSADPILGQVLGDKDGTGRLPWKLALFTYGRQNPIIYLDPDGRDDYVFYYDKPADKAFERAAKTYAAESSRPTHLIPVTTETDFKDQWSKLSSSGAEVDSLVLLGHGGKRGEVEGELYFTPDKKNDGTLSAEEIQLLPSLNYSSKGEIDIRACNSGIGELSVGSNMAQSQGVKTKSMPGYAYFSESPSEYKKTSENSSAMYLKSYERGGNVGLFSFGSGDAMQPVINTPKKKP